MGSSKGSLMVFLSKDARGLQLRHPEISDDYLSGLTYSQIVDKHKLTASLGRDKDWAVSAVGLAIRGMKAGKYLRGFRGLVPDEVWRRIGRERSVANLEGWADANDGEMGFALMSDDEKRDVSLAAIKGRKQVAILDGEAELAYELSRQAEYQNSHGAVWVDVARVVNQDKHEGKDVRTPKAVKSMAYKYSTGGFS